MSNVLYMKTISLSESAYSRLLSWKDGATFSEVIERMVPPKGTLQAALKAAKALPALPEKGFDELERVVQAARKPLPAAWS